MAIHIGTQQFVNRISYKVDGQQVCNLFGRNVDGMIVSGIVSVDCSVEHPFTLIEDDQSVSNWVVFTVCPNPLYNWKKPNKDRVIITIRYADGRSQWKMVDNERDAFELITEAQYCDLSRQLFDEYHNFRWFDK